MKVVVNNIKKKKKKKAFEIMADWLDQEFRRKKDAQRRKRSMNRSCGSI